MLINGDITAYSAKLGILSVVEGAAIIIATCVVSIWPLVTRLVPHSLLVAISCSTPRKPKDRCWYKATMQTSPRSHDELMNHGEDQIQRASIWSSKSCSLAELEDQRLWALDEDGVDSARWEKDLHG